MPLKNNTPILTIIILNYNAKKFALGAVESIEKNYPKEVALGTFQLILVDNGSTDGSIETFKKYKQKTRFTLFSFVENKRNIGFAAGNNKGIQSALGKYILFLNPDTVVYPKTLKRMIDFMDTTPHAGAATCRVEIPNGQLDEASHRGFPTPWNALTHFSGLEKLFPNLPIFAGYTRSFENMTRLHEIPACVGAFLFVRRDAGEKIGWWDEDYFFYGEDLQFCYDLHNAGYKIYYVPDVKILHYGGVSSGIKKHSQDKTTASDETRQKVQYYRFDAMRTFYKKNYSHNHPIISWIVMKGIDFLQRKNTKLPTSPQPSPKEEREIKEKFL